MQCIKVAGDHVEWEHGGNRTVQIAEGPCQVAFDWGDEGSLRVELANGQAPSSNGHVEAALTQEPPPKVRRLLLSGVLCWHIQHFEAIAIESSVLWQGT